jgi:hypothetical protein
MNKRGLALTGMIPPSRPVPVPNGITGTFCWLQILTHSLTWFTDSGNITTSGTQGLYREKQTKLYVGRYEGLWIT